jgi:hypothetical protein
MTIWSTVRSGVVRTFLASSCNHRNGKKLRRDHLAMTNGRNLLLGERSTPQSGETPAGKVLLRLGPMVKVRDFRDAKPE